MFCRRGGHVQAGAGRPRDRDPRRPRGRGPRRARRCGGEAEGPRAAGEDQGRPAALQAARRDRRHPPLGGLARGRARRAQAQAAPGAAAGPGRAREGGCVVRATVWSGRNTVQVENVPDPSILNERDAIVRITSTAICGSDLHLYDGYIPEMKRGDILGHEFMGEVVEKGKGVGNLEVGDRVVVPFPIACGNCWSCKHELYSVCENSNPNSGMAEKLFGHSTCGIFGYSRLTGGYAGGQAEYARVPYADVGPIKIEDDLTDEQVLFLSDIFPTGWF